MGTHIRESANFIGALADNVNPTVYPTGFQAVALGHRELKQRGLALDEVLNWVQWHPTVSVVFLNPGEDKNPMVAEMTLPKIPTTPATKRCRESSFPCSAPSITFLPGFTDGITIRNLSYSPSMIKMFLTRGGKRLLAQLG